MMEKDEEADKRRSLDTGYSWVVMMATFGGFFVAGGLAHTTGIMNTAFLERYGESVARTAWASSLFNSMASFASPVGAVLVDRISCRAALVTGGLLMALGCFITAFSPSIDVCAFACGGIAGTGAGIAFNGLFVVCGFNFKKRLNLAIGVAQTGVGCGLFVLAPVMEAIKANYGYTSFFLFVSGLCLQLAVIGTLMRPSVLERELKQKKKDKSSEKEISVKNHIVEILKAYAYMGSNKSILCLSFSLLMYNGGLYCMFMYWPSLCRAYGLSPMQSSLLLSLTGLTSIPGRLLTGVVATLPIIEESLLYVGSAGIVAVSLILFQFYAASFIGNVVTAVIVGLLHASCFVLISAINIKCVGVRYLSSAIGLEFMAGGIGAISIPVMSGYLISGGWSYRYVFVFCGGCIALASLFALAPRVFRNDAIGDSPHSEQQDIVIMAEKKPFITESHIDDGEIVIELQKQSLPLGI